MSKLERKINLKKCSCNCDVNHVVMKEKGLKRLLLPAGYYGNRYYKSSYLKPILFDLRCESCGEECQTIYLCWWRHDGYHPVRSPYRDNQDDYNAMKEFAESKLTDAFETPLP